VRGPVLRQQASQLRAGCQPALATAAGPRCPWRCPLPFTGLLDRPLRHGPIRLGAAHPLAPTAGLGAGAELASLPAAWAAPLLPAVHTRERRGVRLEVSTIRIAPAVTTATNGTVRYLDAPFEGDGAAGKGGLNFRATCEVGRLCSILTGIATQAESEASGAITAASASAFDSHGAACRQAMRDAASSSRFLLSGPLAANGCVAPAPGAGQWPATGRPLDERPRTGPWRAL